MRQSEKDVGVEWGVVRLADWVWQEREALGLCPCLWRGDLVEAAPIR